MLTVQDKITLVEFFLREQGVKDLSIFFACREQTVQRVLREAIQQLSSLNEKLGTRCQAAERELAVLRPESHLRFVTQEHKPS